jgi:uncharacterized protein (TIGR03086 family)
MSVNLRNYTKAIYGFDHVLRAVSDQHWDRSTPCPPWTVRDLVAHASGVLSMVERGARGSGSAVTTTPSDPRAGWATARDGVLEALDHPGVLGTSVPSPFGTMTMDNLIGILVVDTLVHTWDLARAVGGDEVLAPELVAVAYERMVPLDEGLRVQGRFAAKVAAAPGDDAQTVLLKFLGRQV